MRTLRYLLTGGPRSLDDCLDRSKHAPPESVAVELQARPVFSEVYDMVELRAVCDWRFNGTTVRTHEVCGVIFDRDSDDVRRQQLAGANRRLERLLEQVGALGVHPAGADRRFELSPVTSSWRMATCS